MYGVNISNKGDYVFRVKAGNYEFIVDTKGSGVTPPDTLLASLGTCVGVYIRKYAEGAKLSLEGFSVTAEAEFCKEPPFSFKSIALAVDLKGAVLDERRKRALVEFIKNCPVHGTLKGNPEINITIG